MELYDSVSKQLLDHNPTKGLKDEMRHYKTRIPAVNLSRLGNWN